VIRFLLRGLRAQWGSGRSLFLLSVLGVALGVASVLSIQILNRSALGAFEGSVRAVSGDADLSILPVASIFSEQLYPQVLQDPEVAAAWPLYRIDVALDGSDDRYLEVLGLDLFAPASIPWERPPGDLGSLLSVRGFSAVSPELARERGWDVGSRFAVTSGSQRVELQVGALVDYRKYSPLASTRMLVMDIAQAQSLFGRRGYLHQIDVVLRESADREAAVARLEASLGPAVRVLAPEQRQAEASGLLGAFRLNLTALSLISLFVGGFLVYVTTRAVLVRRRAEFGLLRSLGATRLQVLWWILTEVSWIGLLGSLLGFPLGYAAAAQNLDRVSGTLTNLYMLQGIQSLDLPPWMLLLALGIGLLGALSGALGPALEVSRSHPRELMARSSAESRVFERAPWWALAGLAGVALTALGTQLFASHWRARGFVLGVALLLAIPAATPALMQLATARLRTRVLGVGYGLRTLGARLQTTAFATAALAVAVSMLIGITLMIGSFRRTVDIWIGDTLRADVYVSSPSWRRARDAATLSPEVIARLERQPGVRHVDRLRQFFAYTGKRRISVAGVELGAPLEQMPYQLIEGDRTRALAALQNEGAVLISEPLARKASLGVGDQLELSTPTGPVRLPIAGVTYDYTSELGGAVMRLETLETSFGPGGISNLALYLGDQADASALVERMRAEFRELPLLIRSNRDLRREVFEIFDQTFAVTRLLQAMSLVIAAAGITLTLLVLARERASELALYSALGALRPQLFRVFVGKGLGIALFGLLLGAIGGVLLAFILIYWVNRAYFGWTIALYWPWAALAQQALAILLAAIVASLYPALRASRTPATELSRENL